jgi:hypothetical protein
MDTLQDQECYGGGGATATDGEAVNDISPIGSDTNTAGAMKALAIGIGESVLFERSLSFESGEEEPMSKQNRRGFTLIEHLSRERSGEEGANEVGTLRAVLLPYLKQSPLDNAGNFRRGRARRRATSATSPTTRSI